MTARAFLITIVAAALPAPLSVVGAPSGVIAITGAQIYTAAALPPIPHASIVIAGGRILAAGAQVQIPPHTTILRCDGCSVMAGFWNSHVHFTEPKWDRAATQSASKLAGQLQTMLLRSGFVTVADTGSLLANTLDLRRRIERGDVPGPRIYTAGIPLYPPDGIPYYVKESLPAEVLAQLATPGTPAGAAQHAEANLRNGADFLKLFTGSWISRSQVASMPEPIAAAAVAVAHTHHKLVFSHPSNLAGIQVAIHSGVDVLAHAPDDTTGIDDTVLRSAIEAHMAMIPTLKLFSGAGGINGIRRLVRRFQELGGELIFGTDTGYLADYDVAEEYRQLEKAGFGVVDILRMLTENPARRFGVEEEQGQSAPGMAADLTILASDPARDIAAFSHVRYTIRGGRIIYAGRSVRTSR